MGPEKRKSEASRGETRSENSRASNTSPRSQETPPQTKGGEIPDLSLAEAHRLIQELQTAKRDLELRNEELRTAQEESEGLYRLLAETVTDVVWLADVDFECSYVSPSIEQLLGYTVDEIMALSITEVVTPSSLAQLRAISEEERLLEEKGLGDAHRSLVLELEMVRKNGATVHVEATAVIKRDADGRFTHIVGVARNIEDRKNAEKVLRASERRLRVTLDAVSDGVWDYDIAAGKLHTGPRCLDLLGYLPHEVEDTIEFWWGLMHTEDRARLAERYRDHIDGKASRFEAEFRLRDSEGGWIWILGLGQVVAWDTDLQPTRILGALTEVGARVEAEAQVRLLSSVVEQSAVSIAVADPEGHLTFVNSACGALFGYAPDEMIGKHLAMLHRPEDMPIIRAANERLWESGNFKGVIPFRDRNGRIFPCMMRNALLRDRDGNPVAMVGTFDDISESATNGRAAHSLEEAQRLAVENMPVLVSALDEHGTIIVWNRECESVTGYAAEDIVGNPHALDMLYPEPAYRQSIQESLRGQERRAQALEFTLTRKDGGTRTIAWSNVSHASPIPGWAVWAVGVDVTERVEFEEKLRQSEERYRSFVQNFPGIAFRGTVDFVPQFFHGAVEKITGYTEADFVAGKPRWDEVIHPDDLPRVMAIGDSLRNEPGFSSESEYRIVRKDGHIRWICQLIHSVRDPSEQAAHVEGTLYDITQRKQAEEALRESEARLRLAMQGAALGMWERDIPTGRLLFNERWAEILGHAPDEITPHTSSWEDRLHPEDRARTLAAMADHLEGRAPFYEGEFRMRTKSGDWRWILSRGSVVERDDKGRPLRTAGTHVDISARKAAEERRRKVEAQVQQTQKLETLGVLAGGIAHDFNNILMAITGNADLVLQDLPKDSPFRPRIEEVEKATRRAVSLTRQMLAYSGKGRMATGPVDLSQTVAEISHLLRSSIPEGVVVTLNLDEALPAIRADGAQIQQVVMNLLLNASEAFGDDPHGDITVSTGVREYDRVALERAYLNEDLPEGRYVYLEIADTGDGMDEEVLDRIFDPFYTTKFTGRGLGLAALLGIVRGHNGTVMVKSEPGAGTTFAVLFPAPDPSPAEPPEPPRFLEPAWTGSGTVLLVDDEETVREVSGRMLERMGLRVLTAADGREALNVCQEHLDEIDCILLDLTMPNMGGEQAYQALRALRQDVPIVLSSGFGERELAERFGDHDIAGVIQKPYKITALTAMMREVLEG